MTTVKHPLLHFLILHIRLPKNKDHLHAMEDPSKLHGRGIPSYCIASLIAYQCLHQKAYSIETFDSITFCRSPSFLVLTVSHARTKEMQTLSRTPLFPPIYLFNRGHVFKRSRPKNMNWFLPSTPANKQNTKSLPSKLLYRHLFLSLSVTLLSHINRLKWSVKYVRTTGAAFVLTLTAMLL